MGAALAQQTTLALEAGAVSVRFADQGQLSALTVSPSLSVRTSQVSLALLSSASQVRAGSWSTQGTAALAWFTRPTARGLVGEAAGIAGGSAFPGGARTAQAIGSARVHWIGPQLSTWVGAGLGSMHDGTRTRSVRQGELGASLYHQGGTLTLVVTPSVTRDASEALGYTDMLGVLGRSVGVVDLSASLGGRVGATLPIAGGAQRLWGGVNIAAWIAPRAAFMMGIGTYPVDVTQGFPAGQYVSAGLRVGASRAVRSQEISRARRIRSAARASGVTDFTLRRSAPSVYEVRVRARAASAIQLNGDVTGWLPITLVRDEDGWWRGQLRITSGTAEIVIRVNGGEWLVPPGADEIVDEFGGRSGRVVVPES